MLEEVWSVVVVSVMKVATDAVSVTSYEHMQSTIERNILITGNLARILVWRFGDFAENCQI